MTATFGAIGATFCAITVTKCDMVSGSSVGWYGGLSGSHVGILAQMYVSIKWTAGEIRANMRLLYY